MMRSLKVFIPRIGIFLFVYLFTLTPAWAQTLFTITVDTGQYSFGYKIDDIFGSGTQDFELEEGTHTFSASPLGGSFTFDVDASGDVTSNQLASATGSGSILVLNNVSVMVDPGNYTPSYQIDGVSGSGPRTIVMVPDVAQHLFVTFLNQKDVSANDTGITIDGVTANPNSVEIPPGNFFTFSLVTVDEDGDGVPDDVDECLESDLSDTVVIDGIDTGVPNSLFDTGCTISDLIEDLAEEALTHGDFVNGVAHLTNSLKKLGVITGPQKGAIQSAAAQADIP